MQWVAVGPQNGWFLFFAPHLSRSSPECSSSGLVLDGRLAVIEGRGPLVELEVRQMLHLRCESVAWRYTSDHAHPILRFDRSHLKSPDGEVIISHHACWWIAGGHIHSRLSINGPVRVEFSDETTGEKETCGVFSSLAVMGGMLKSSDERLASLHGDRWQSGRTSRFWPTVVLSDAGSAGDSGTAK